MKRTFISTNTFLKCWDSLGLNDDDLLELENYIMKNPQAGDIIVGTGGLKKLRWALPNTGKRDGIRVLTVDFVFYETVILLNCYGKSEQDNISDNEKAIYKNIIKDIEKELKEKS